MFPAAKLGKINVFTFLSTNLLNGNCSFNKSLFTAKLACTSPSTIVEITETYGREEAHEVIRRSVKDYDKSFRSHMDLGM